MNTFVPRSPPVGAPVETEDEPRRDESGVSGDETAAPQTLTRIDDRLARGVGIPAFGIAIPHLTGLFGTLTPTDGLHWLGYLVFIGLAFMIWQGNRWLLFRQREHWDWFQHPLRKLMFMLSAAVFYTAPLTVGWLYGWYELAPMDVDWQVVQTVTLANVICVIFVTHGYETAFLIRERRGDHLAAERLRRAKAEAELDALRSQVDPHFLFNSLNTLAQLVEEEPRRSLEFIESLADTYRYILSQRGRSLVLLRDELAFVERYFFLLELRHGDALVLELSDPDDRAGRLLVPPVALQGLVENAVKHNRFSAAEPLVVHLVVNEDGVLVHNPIRPRSSHEDSPGSGLANLSERYFLTTGREIRVDDADGRFSVHLPALLLTA